MKYKLIPTLEIWEQTILELEALGWLGSNASHWNLRNMWEKYKEDTVILWTPEWSLIHKKDNPLLNVTVGALPPMTIDTTAIDEARKFYIDKFNQDIETAANKLACSVGYENWQALINDESRFYQIIIEQKGGVLIGKVTEVKLVKIIDVVTINMFRIHPDSVTL